MKLTISAEGAEIVRQGLQNLGAEIPLIGRQGLRTIVNRIIRIMQVYPPEPEGQSVSFQHATLGTAWRPAKGRYRRTGRLGASWKVEQTESGYTIENNASSKGKRYAGFVVGNAYGQGQAWMHVDRWNVFRDIVDQEMEKAPKEVEEHITMAARRKGL